MIATFCIGEETQNFFAVSLSHNLRFTGVQGRFLASLEMTIWGKRYSRFAAFRIEGRGTRQRRSGAFSYRLVKTLFLSHFHTASTLSVSLRSPPSPCGEGFLCGESGILVFQTILISLADSVFACQ